MLTAEDGSRCDYSVVRCVPGAGTFQVDAALTAVVEPDGRTLECGQARVAAMAFAAAALHRSEAAA